MLIDDYSRFTWLFPLREKSNFFECFIKFQKLVENQFTQHINLFQSDSGGEFKYLFFQEHLSKHGIVHQMSCPAT